MSDTRVVRLVPGREIEVADGVTVRLQTTETTDGRYLRGADIEVQIDRSEK